MNFSSSVEVQILCKLSWYNRCATTPHPRLANKKKEKISPNHTCITINLKSICFCYNQHFWWNYSPVDRFFVCHSEHGFIVSLGIVSDRQNKEFENKVWKNNKDTNNLLEKEKNILNLNIIIAKFSVALFFIAFLSP